MVRGVTVYGVGSGHYLISRHGGRGRWLGFGTDRLLSFFFPRGCEFCSLHSHDYHFEVPPCPTVAGGGKGILVTAKTLFTASIFTRYVVAESRISGLGVLG